MVLWGKGKEIRRIAQLMPSRSSKEEPEQIQISARSSVESASMFAPTFFTMVDSDTTVSNNVQDHGLPISHESRLEEGKEGETGKLDFFTIIANCVEEVDDVDNLIYIILKNNF
ncbi:hypothetical protein RJ639_010890 [Escallonia herrerae]|uniref:Uncharacterized protein n=1 Tax=Escallonia herrerae TaxID=1293975 RepID=A0AA89ARC3_9ASTE|nr:hypothetical protein RJ639_010890 [Escallonia herrerae]